MCLHAELSFVIQYITTSIHYATFSHTFVLLDCYRIATSWLHDNDYDLTWLSVAIMSSIPWALRCLSPLHERTCSLSKQVIKSTRKSFFDYLHWWTSRYLLRAICGTSVWNEEWVFRIFDSYPFAYIILQFPYINLCTFHQHYISTIRMRFAIGHPHTMGVMAFLFELMTFDHYTGISTH